MCFNKQDAYKLALDSSLEAKNQVLKLIQEECRKGYFHIVIRETICTDAVRLHLKELGFSVNNPNTNNGIKNVTIRWDQ